MSDQIHWKHTWPSAQVLAQFLINNRAVVRGRTVVELGSGCTGIVGLAAGKSGAERVIHTDHPDIKELFSILQENIVHNKLEHICRSEGLDWNNPIAFVDNLQSLDIVVASDVFFDPSVFRSLVNTISLLLNKFPNSSVLFAYQNRDDNWSIADLLQLHNLECTLIRSIDTHQHTIQLGWIYKKDSQMEAIYGGIEGGGSFSKLVLMDGKGNSLGEFKTTGTNLYLNGLEKTANDIAKWVREAKIEKGINGPLKTLGMGLSGAEDDRLNSQLVEFIQSQHSDIAEHCHVTSDGVCTIAATFQNGGVVVISGTGSTCRLLTSSGSIHGVGGWGHAIGDGGSGYWIANRAIRLLFDVDDGLVVSEHSIEPLRKLLHEHFEIDDKIQMLDFLYAKFVKADMATFTAAMAENLSDPVISSLFYDGGYELGRHVAAVSRHMDEEMRANVPIVAVGSVFKSWIALKQGFTSALHSSSLPIHKISLYQLCESNSFGAAALAAHQIGIQIPFKHQPQLFDTIQL